MSHVEFLETRFSLRCEVLPGIQTTLVPNHALAHGLSKSLKLESGFSIRLDLLASHFVVRTAETISERNLESVFVSGSFLATIQKVREDRITLPLEIGIDWKGSGDFCTWHKAPKERLNERIHSISKRSLPEGGRETLVFQDSEPGTGRPRALLKDEKRLRWFFERNGFELPEGTEALERCLEFISPFSLSPSRSHEASISAHGAFRFHGKLKIKNLELASRALIQGLGSRRSYAFGCLQLVNANQN